MSKKGVVRDLKRGSRISEPYDSKWECDYMLLLDSDETIKRWERCWSLRIPYTKSNGEKGYYNPDFIVERLDGQKEIHEVKGGHLMSDLNTQRKLAAGEAFCRTRDMIFKLITKR